MSETLGSSPGSFPVGSSSVLGAETELVPVDVLVPADSPRLSGENTDHVHRLARLAEDLSPIVVHRDTMRVIDGMHRLRAAVLSGRDVIRVRFFDGTSEDAFLLAVTMNVTQHGLPLSLADRRAAAVRIIGAHEDWSDRAIAAITGLSHKTIGTVRRRSSGKIPQSDHRIGRDGRIRPTDNARARRLAGDLIARRPGASLREIAKEVGISPSTVRDVRNRLLGGEDPVLPPQRHIDEVALGRREDATILWRLRRDPALRLSESGRVLLRLLEASVIRPARWEYLAANVPAHCAEMVAVAARRCGQAWLDFAARIDEAPEIFELSEEPDITSAPEGGRPRR